MNLFVLDLNPECAARYHCDKHVVKMILETAQLLSTAHDYQRPRSRLPVYRPTHVNHPCATWVRRSAANYRWAYALFCALSREYTYRYNKTHLTYKKLGHVLWRLPSYLTADAHLMHYDVQSFALAMPDEYKNFDSAVQSYRNYYKGEKHGIAKWSVRPVPDWWHTQKPINYQEIQKNE